MEEVNGETQSGTGKKRKTKRQRLATSLSIELIRARGSERVDDACKRLGVARGTLSRWEQEQGAPPHRNRWMQIADYCGLDLTQVARLVEYYGV